MAEFFPPGIVTGPNFCNRSEERRELALRIVGGAHTWLMSPRRYGKTSLIHQVIEDLAGQRKKYAHATADLLRAHDAESFDGKILEAVGALGGQLSTTQTAVKSASRFLQRLQPQVAVDDGGPRITFGLKDPMPDDVTSALLNLDALAGSRRRRGVLILDEFQVAGDFANHTAIEASVRHAVERAKHITYILSGSNRRFLAQMFEDSQRPLYHLCERLVLPRISRDDLRDFLVARAVGKWNAELAPDITERILDLTDGHPYFVGLLCRRLWRGRKPSLAAVESTWAGYVREEEHVYAGTLQKLAPIQRGILAAVAEQSTKHLLGKAFLRRLRLTTASAQRAVAALKSYDHIYHDTEQDAWKVLDPGLANYLREN
jgi:AAA+ ATPase superfamily predicted ATPase